MNMDSFEKAKSKQKYTVSEEKELLLSISDKRFLCPYCSTEESPTIHNYESKNWRKRCFHQAKKYLTWYVDWPAGKDPRKYIVKISPQDMTLTKWISGYRTDIENVRKNGAPEGFIENVQEYRDLHSSARSAYTQTFDVQYHVRKAVNEMKQESKHRVQMILGRKKELEEILQPEIKVDGYLRINDCRFISFDDIEAKLLKDSYASWRRDSILTRVTPPIRYVQWTDEGYIKKAMVRIKIASIEDYKFDSDNPDHYHKYLFEEKGWRTLDAMSWDMYKNAFKKTPVPDAVNL